MAIVAIALPFVLLVSAWWVGMQDSMSAFYYTNMRNLFVGAIFAIGMCLYAYKGYNNRENTCLTVGGVFLFFVALFPTNPVGPDKEIAQWIPAVHYVSAICFFALIGYVCVFARAHGLSSSDKGHDYNRDYSRTYNIIAIVMMTVLVFAIWTVSDALLGKEFKGTRIFWIEASAIWTFAAYWIAKSQELNELEQAIGANI